MLKATTALVLSVLAAPASARDYKAEALEMLARTKIVVGECVAKLVSASSAVAFGGPAKREFNNLSAFIENQSLIHVDSETAGSYLMFAKAYRELEPERAEHLELIYYVGERELFVENEHRPVRFKRGTVLIVDRFSHLVVSYADAELLQRVTRWSQIRASKPSHLLLRHGH